MTNEEINIAIAEACGWKFIPEYCHGEDQPPEFTTVTPDGKHLCGYYPDYSNDLNAMQEAKQALWKMDWYYRYIFNDHLANIIKGRIVNRNEWDAETLLDATAEQQAESFLRTLNLWVE